MPYWKFEVCIRNETLIILIFRHVLLLFLHFACILYHLVLWIYLDDRHVYSFIFLLESCFCRYRIYIGSRLFLCEDCCTICSGRNITNFHISQSLSINLAQPRVCRKLYKNLYGTLNIHQLPHLKFFMNSGHLSLQELLYLGFVSSLLFLILHVSCPLICSMLSSSFLNLLNFLLNLTISSFIFFFSCLNFPFYVLSSHPFNLILIPVLYYCFETSGITRHTTEATWWVTASSGDKKTS